MNITNQSKPTTSLTNSDKVSFAVTWDTWDTAWEDETRTWDELGSIIENTSRGATGFFFSNTRFPFSELSPFIIEGGIVNVSKP